MRQVAHGFGRICFAEYRKSVPRSCVQGGYFNYKMARVSVYIDGANFLYGVRSINKRYTDFKFDFEKFIKHIVSNRELIQVYYYNAPLKLTKDPELAKQQQRFFSRLRNTDKFKVILCKRQRRIKDDGQEVFTIKGDDIHLAIDMLKDACENKYEDAILISGDGDFTPLVKYVREKGKRVENYHFFGNISLDLIRECNTNAIIDKKIVNKYFFRETQSTLADTKSGEKIKEFLKQKKK
jgi:uncharacterized LabA/DUF88 family protein